MAARFSALCVICFAVPLCVSAVPPGRFRNPIKGISRNRRAVCEDGTYDFEGRKCCYCPAGQRLVEHCSNNNNMTGKCDYCEDGTYNSHPSSEKTCQPCTSCTQQNANLEVEEPCTPARDTKCRCKKDHFCSSKECTICHPCKTCGVGGIKTDCTPTSDRICNEDAGAIVGIVFGVLLFAAIIAGVVYWTGGHHVFPWRRQRTRDGENQSEAHVEIPLLPDNFNIDPLLPDIANELGWKDMKNIALRTGVSKTIIESFEIDHQNSAEERTLQLLMRWVEKESKDSPKKLIQTLKQMDKNGKAERISDILKNAISASSNNSGTNN